MTRTRSLSLGAASLAAVAAVTFGATQATAQPIITGGLVDVTINDVTVNALNDVTVAAAIQAAVTACGVGVNVLATQLPGPVSCTTTTGDLLQIVPA